MNEFESVSDRQIDRMVDGEMPSAERRAVLIALDQEGDGWRRLALAFLESQTLRESLKNQRTTVASPGVTDSLPVAAVPLPQPAKPAAPQRWRSLMPLAACAAVMFAVGRWSRTDPAVIPTSVAQNELPAPGTYVSETSSDPVPALDKVPQSSDQVVAHQTLRLELGNGQDVEVPVVENSRLRPEDLWKAPPVIPVSMQRELLRSGRRVYEQRQLFEVTLEDGRTGIVPVSDVLVENAGLDVYQ